MRLAAAARITKMQYQELKDRLKELQCPTCGGIGEYDDAEPGDISMNTYVCGHCKGTGWNDGKERTLTTAA